MTIMTMILLKCSSSSPHDFTREHANVNGKNLVMLIRSAGTTLEPVILPEWRLGDLRHDIS